MTSLPQIKRVAFENWLDMDSSWQGTYGMDCTDEAKRAWIEHVKSFTLSASVPEHIEALFATVLNALAYSYFYYPLMTLCSEQALRVVEAALREKCNQMRAPPLSSIKSTVDWLIARQGISTSDRDRWEALRMLRNHSSHPRSPSIINVAMMQIHIETAAEFINHLFDSKTNAQP
jgi:hypothetical protein